jgi:hypothetical protein
MSDNKLIENKQVLNESFVEAAPFIFLGLYAVIGWALKKWAPFFNPYGRNKEYGISKEVFDAISKLYLDKEFVKDFVNILKKESNLNDIIAKAQKEYYTDLYKKDSKHRSSQFDKEDYQQYIKGNIKGLGFQPEAKKIAQSVIKSNGYKKFSKKYKFTADDDKDMVGVIYYIVTRPDFADTAEKYLYTAASNNKNITIPPLPKGAFEDPFGVA